MPSYGKMMRRGLLGSLSRFLSILAIVGLGVGFLCGLLSTEEDMKVSADEYLRSHKTMDQMIVASLGFSDSDIKAIEDESYVKDVQAGYMLDTVFMDGNEESYTTRMVDYDFEDLSKNLNQAELLEGRWPKADDECVICLPNNYIYEIPLGDTIELDARANGYEDAKDLLTEEKFTVVGTVSWPLFVSMYGEATKAGSGLTDMAVFVNRDIFAMDDPVVCYVRLKDDQKLRTYSDDYKDLLDETKESLASLGNARCEIRTKELKEKAADAAREELVATYGPAAAAMEIPDIDIGKATWSVTSRLDNTGIRTYEGDSEKIGAIAKVFPIFFFLVAALVALTTMTRMVDEERSKIGALKSLGYSNFAIAGYYLLFSALGTLVGCVLGIPLGSVLFPTVISNAYKMLYVFPKVSTTILWHIALPVSAGLLAVILLVTGYSCYEQLREKPAELLLPKAPKAGKRIFLERISFLWRPLKFSQKATLRNIFRYKKRFLMTIIGVAGCFALLLTGFGIRNSISDIVDLQFKEIYHFDETLNVDEESAITKDPTIRDILEDKDLIASYHLYHEEAFTAEKGGEDTLVTLRVPQVPKNIDKDITLRERTTKKSILLTDEGVILTEKAGETLDVTAGDEIVLASDDREDVTVKVLGLTEHYVSGFVYMTPNLFEDLYGEKPDYTTVQIIETGGHESEVISGLLASDHTVYAMESADVVKNFEDSIGSIDNIVIVLIVSALALAIIVLYSLTNINVRERKKELATLRVLGFYKNETAAYIFREVDLLTVFGILAGIPVGIWLHHFVILTAEVEGIMFGREIYWHSYIIAAALTLLFTFLVNRVMRRIVGSVDMVESMKSVD